MVLLLAVDDRENVWEMLDVPESVGVGGGVMVIVADLEIVDDVDPVLVTERESEGVAVAEADGVVDNVADRLDVAVRETDGV